MGERGDKIETEVQYDRAIARVGELLPLTVADTPLDGVNLIEPEWLSNPAADYSDKIYAVSDKNE